MWCIVCLGVVVCGEVVAVFSATVVCVSLFPRQVPLKVNQTLFSGFSSGVLQNDSQVSALHSTPLQH